MDSKHHRARGLDPEPAASRSAPALNRVQLRRSLRQMTYEEQLEAVRPPESVQFYPGEGLVDAARERAGSLVASVADWGVEQIGNAEALLRFLSEANAELGRRMVDSVAQANPSVLVSFLTGHPDHALASYIAGRIDPERLARLVQNASAPVVDLVRSVVCAAGTLVELVEQLARTNLDAAKRFCLRLETEHLPAVLEAVEGLGAQLFNEWWPAGSGFEGQFALSVGAEVPVWPEPVIEIGGTGNGQFTVKLYNRTSEENAGPTIEFSVENQLGLDSTVGVKLPEAVGATTTQGRQIAAALKATTRFGDVSWDVGLITSLRGGNRQGAYQALRAAAGNALDATQFEFTLNVQLTQATGASAGIQGVAQERVSALMGLGFQVAVETPTPARDGKIEANGNFNASITAQVRANLQGIPGSLGSVVSYLQQNANAGGQARTEIGGRLAFKIPRGDITDMAAPQFDYVELYVGGGARANLAQEQVEVTSEGAIRLSADDLAAWQVPDLTDGLDAEELRNTLPFTHLGYKASVEVTSGLIARQLRDMLTDNRAAAEFFLSNPTVSGKVELELKFTKDRIVQLLVDIGALGGAGGVNSAVNALVHADVLGFLRGLQQAQHVGRFMFDSIDKVTVEVSATESRSSPEADIDEITLSASGSLRASFSHEFGRTDLARGARQLSQFLVHALPDDLAPIVTN